MGADIVPGAGEVKLPVGNEETDYSVASHVEAINAWRAFSSHNAAGPSRLSYDLKKDVSIR